MTARQTMVAVPCPECSAPIEGGADGLGPATYCCSRCGSVQVDERRCEGCHIFMGKESDASCPECEAGIEPSDLGDEITLWAAADGSWHDSEEEAEAWDAAAPERAARAAENRERRDRVMEAHEAERSAAAAEISALFERVRPRLAAAPELCEHLRWQIEDAGWISALSTVMVPVDEIVGLLVPELPKPSPEGDFDRDFDERRAYKTEGGRIIRDRWPTMFEGTSTFVWDSQAFGANMLHFLTEFDRLDLP